MHPFLAQYLPTEMSRNKDDLGMKSAKRAGFRAGKEWMSKYLFRIPYRTSDKVTMDENHDGEDHDENEVNVNDREMEDGGGNE